MADQIKEKYNEEAELVKLSGGIFEVYRNHELIFSKRQLGRFPEEGEIVKLVDAMESGTPLAQAQAEFSKSKPSGGFLQRLLGRF